MARPKTALISKSRVVDVALAIIDADGLDALSIRRLGRELEINGASLYHHFRNKDEILLAVRQRVLAPIRLPTEAADWRDGCVRIAIDFRAALLAHPNAAPLMVTTSSRRLSAPLRDFMAKTLRAQGVDASFVYSVLDSFSTLAFGSVMFNVGVDEPVVTFGAVADEYLDLAIAVEDDQLAHDERFEATARALAVGWSALVGKPPAARSEAPGNDAPTRGLPRPRFGE